MSDNASSKEIEYFFRQDDRLLLLTDYLDRAEKIQCKKGSCIIASCQSVDHLYFLVKGIAHHSILTPQGKERIIHVLIAPSLCAESLFFLNINSDSSEQIVAKTDCTLYRFNRALIDELLLTLPELNRVIINWLCTLSLNAHHQVADDLVKDPRYRVCKFIYKYVLEYGHKLENNHYVYYGKLSHYDISKYIGINRVSVSTVMRNLEVEGLINKTNERLEILDMDYFEDMCDLPFQCL
ncbi:MAG: Crp/Fnr family transcriptional regulator [Peptococcaceae bacterium]|nr:Crp/Fnr family transcriptional regulator [Peptococcaceae bacterium]